MNIHVTITRRKPFKKRRAVLDIDNSHEALKFFLKAGYQLHIRTTEHDITHVYVEGYLLCCVPAEKQ